MSLSQFNIDVDKVVEIFEIKSPGIYRYWSWVREVQLFLVIKRERWMTGTSYRPGPGRLGLYWYRSYEAFRLRKNVCDWITGSSLTVFSETSTSLSTGRLLRSIFPVAVKHQDRSPIAKYSTLLQLEVADIEWIDGPEQITPPNEVSSILEATR